MNINKKIWYLDFSENGQMWHHDLERVPENESWVNIGFGNHMILDYFCDMVDMMRREFGIKFSTEQIIRLAECTPGLNVYSKSPIPDDDLKKELHEAPIYSRKKIEEHIEWKLDED